MHIRRTQIALFCAVAGLALLVTSCSSGPVPPEKGTPAFYWLAANETFSTGDYLKANDHLDQITRGKSEYVARALPWRLVLAAGMTKGFMELADSFEYGARANRANPTPFRKQVSSYRAYASQLSMQFVEAFHRFEQENKDEKILLAFSFPTGSAAEVPQLSKISQGMQLQPSEVEDIQKRNMERAVLLQTCKTVGAADDSAKTQEIFKTGKVEVPRNVFMLAMANALYEQSQMFSRTKLDRPDKLELLCKEATEALKDVPASKDTKALQAKIQKALKTK